MSSVVQQDEDVQIPVPELLGALLEKGGSDLHLTAGSPPMVRVHGELEAAGGGAHGGGVPCGGAG